MEKAKLDTVEEFLRKMYRDTYKQEATGKIRFEFEFYEGKGLGPSPRIIQEKFARLK